MKIKYSIISRGTMQIKYSDKTVEISGELIFEPPTFYADINAFNNWEPPFENIKISENEKNEIIKYIEKDSLENSKTKIIFD
jgi:hypothetical protein